MAVTKTETVTGLLNYGLISRQSTSPENRRLNDSLPTIIENLTDIYTNGIRNGQYTEAEIEDFQEQLSCANYLDNRALYPGLERSLSYCTQAISTAKLEKTDTLVR